MNHVRHISVKISEDPGNGMGSYEKSYAIPVDAQAVASAIFNLLDMVAHSYQKGRSYPQLSSTIYTPTPETTAVSNKRKVALVKSPNGRTYPPEIFKDEVNRRFQFKNKGVKYGPWSEDELKTLARLWAQGWDLGYINAVLDRTVPSVKHKVYRRRDLCPDNKARKDAVNNRKPDKEGR